MISRLLKLKSEILKDRRETLERNSERMSEKNQRRIAGGAYEEMKADDPFLCV